MAAFRFHVTRMHSLPLNPDKKQTEWEIIPSISKNKNIPQHLLLKLNREIPHKICRPAAKSLHYTISCKHSLVFLRMGEIIARNMLSWLKSLINCYCCIWFVVHIIISIPSCSKHRIHAKTQSFQFPIRHWTWHSIIYYLNSQSMSYNLFLTSLDVSSNLFYYYRMYYLKLVKFLFLNNAFYLYLVCQIPNLVEEIWLISNHKALKPRCKGKAIPVQGWEGSEGPRSLRIPDFKTINIWRW